MCNKEELENCRIVLVILNGKDRFRHHLGFSRHFEFLSKATFFLMLKISKKTNELTYEL
jgi:hypothetical protein